MKITGYTVYTLHAKPAESLQSYGAALIVEPLTYPRLTKKLMRLYMYGIAGLVSSSLAPLARSATVVVLPNPGTRISTPGVFVYSLVAGL